MMNSAVGRLRLWLYAELGTTCLPVIGLLTVLPATILVASPARPLPSYLIAGVYLAAATVWGGRTRGDRLVAVYALVAGAFVALSLLRSAFVDPETVAQHAYAFDKASYFMFAVLPLSLAVALLIPNLRLLKAPVVVFIGLGILLAASTLILHKPVVLGTQRYTWQGNLSALAALLLFQFWVLRRFWIGAALGAFCLAGVAFALSRQSIAAVVVGFIATIVYWLGANLQPRSNWSRPRRVMMWLVPLVITLVGVLTLGAWLYFGYRRARGLSSPGFIPDPSNCNCVANRFLALLKSLGSRDTLLVTGWDVFAHHPIVGAGLGSFAGLVPPYQYPHNVPLEVGAEMGIFGVVVLIIPMLLGFGRLYLVGLRIASPGLASLLTIVLVFFVVANLSGDLPSARPFWIFGLVAMKLALRPEIAREQIPSANTGIGSRTHQRRATRRKPITA